ncbi:MAG: Ppx/GppA family phosphatase [Candidatus Eremiobacteraeota bacterium]|nr:Ppx/GppA family phosphatase [Candidatus Eremiobacteraeota bacterium]
MRLGAIDVGTNSIHLIVVEVDPESLSTSTVFKAREMVRLGADDALERGTLGKRAMSRAVEAIARFVRLARERGAERIRAVATSAVREAQNGKEFALEVRRLCGISLEILDEREEARLIYLGVARNFPIYERLACIIDIGGGSTEFIVADDRRAYLLESVKLGSLRLYDAYLRGDEPPYPRYPQLVAQIHTLLEPVARRLREFDCDVFIGTSGTIMGLGMLDAAERGDRLLNIHGHVVTLERLRALQARMLALGESGRRALPGMNARRADIIVAGAAILIEALGGIGAREIVVSQHALREGVVIDLVQADSDIARRLDDLRTRRREAIVSLARRYQSAGLHERSVARLSLRIFDDLTPYVTLQPPDRELLYAAALLHDIGKFVNLSAHHKHSAYLIRNSPLDGWSQAERETLATLVRYHRKSQPKSTHPEWENLTPAHQDRIALLAGILRAADGLDVRHQGRVGDVRLRFGSTAVVLEVDGDDDVTSELAAAEFKADLLGKALGRTVTTRGTAAVRKEA